MSKKRVAGAAGQRSAAAAAADEEDEGHAALLAALAALIAIDDAQERAWVLDQLTAGQLLCLRHFFPGWAHGGQTPPDERKDWRVWVMRAGRGFGKTRAGAEWITGLARADGSLRFALVGATLDEVDKVMVRGDSGLIAVAAEAEDIDWVPSRGFLRFESGAEAYAYSGAKPDKLRGPQHDYAWCDELAKWNEPEATWSNLMLTMRLKERAQVVVTTTPRPIALLAEIEADPASVVTRGATRDNIHLPDAFVADMERRFGGTLLGRQELEGEIVEEVEGALWTRAGIEAARVLFEAPLGASGARSVPSRGADVASGPTPLDFARDERSGGDAFLVRVVIGVDPPASAEGDACGIVACALGADGIGYVLGDHSVKGASPEQWAAAVAAAAEAHGADKVVAEANNGGAMVKSVLVAAQSALPVKLVHASRGKAARAEPVAALFTGGRARFAGRFKELEAELCGMGTAGTYGGPGRSPDRADAMVWALSELMLGRKGAPTVRAL
jgi:phage terminase large subunit-like protein